MHASKGRHKRRAAARDGGGCWWHAWRGGTVDNCAAYKRWMNVQTSEFEPKCFHTTAEHYFWFEATYRQILKMKTYSTLECTWLLFINCWAICLGLSSLFPLYICHDCAEGVNLFCWCRACFQRFQLSFYICTDSSPYVRLSELEFLVYILHFACIKHFCSCNVVVSRTG
jgi:hypothetical protein